MKLTSDIDLYSYQPSCGSGNESEVFIVIRIVSAIIQLIIMTLLGVDAAGEITGGELALST